MFKHLNNNKGVALLTVMAVMAVLVVVGGTMLYMVSSEGKIIYDYGNNTRAFYIAEAGADFAIKQWDKYIQETYNSSNEDGGAIKGSGELKSVSIDEFINQIKMLDDQDKDNDNVKDILDWLKTSYGKDFLKIEFDTKQKGLLANSVNASDAEILTIKVTGSYDETDYDYDVKLWYYWDGSTGSYKGLGEPVVAPEPTRPGEDDLSFTIITNHLFTSHLKDFTGLFNDAPHIVGNVLIGPDKLSDSFLTYGTSIEGNLFVYDSLEIMGGLKSKNNVGFDTKIKGDLNVQGKTKIYSLLPSFNLEWLEWLLGQLIGELSSEVIIEGNYYHEGNVIADDENLKVSGEEEQRDVKIPQLELPQLHPLNWYREQDYSIINNSNGNGNGNGNKHNWHDWQNNKNSKIYFNVSHFKLEADDYFENNDVAVVAKKSLTIGRNFKGSGVIFAPKGAVFFEPGSQFTGTVICEYLYLFHDVHIQSKEQTIFPY